MAKVRWSDVEKSPWFAPLSSEEKAGVLDRWTKDQLDYLVDDEEKLVLEASSDALRKSFFGEPLPTDLGQYVQDFGLKKMQAKAAQEAERDLPFMSLGDTASALYDAVRGLPPTLKASYYQLKERDTRPDLRSEEYKQAMADRDAYLESLQTVPDDQKTDVGEAIRGAAGSLAFTGVGMGAAVTGGAIGRGVGTYLGGAIGGLGGAALGAPTGPGAAATATGGTVAGAALGGQIGQYVGALGGSAIAAYNLAYEDFRHEAFKQAEQNKGAKLTDAEADALDKQIAPLAENTAAWEAGPEAIGNAIGLGTAKAIYGLTKEAFAEIGKRTLGRLAKAGAVQAGGTGMELLTEAITQYEQAYDHAKLEALMQGRSVEEAVRPYERGLGGYWEAGKDVAPTVLALQGMLGGGAALAGKIFSKKPTSLTEDNFRQYLTEQRAAAVALRDAQESAEGETPSLGKRVKAYDRLKFLDKVDGMVNAGNVEDAASMLNIKIVSPAEQNRSAAAPTTPETPPVTPDIRGDEERATTPQDRAVPLILQAAANKASDNNAPFTAKTLLETSAALADAAIPFRTTEPTPTPTIPYATFQGQVPESRVEERQPVDEGRTPPETGGGNRPVQGGQEQAQEENVTRLLQNLRESVGRMTVRNWSDADYAAAASFFATGDEKVLAALPLTKQSMIRSIKKKGVGESAPAPTPAPAPAPAPVPSATAQKPPARKPTLGRNAFGTYDLLDFLQENNIVIPKASARKGAGEYNWLEKGDLRSLLPSIATYTGGEAGNVDTLAQQAYDYTLPDGTPSPLIAGPYADDLIEGIRNTWAARQQSRAAGVASGQGIAPEAEKIRKRFEKAIYGKTGTLVDFEDVRVRVGDKLTIDGQEMTVVDMVFPEDETATVPEMIYVDGPFFGRQFIGTDTPVRVDSIEKAERPPVDEFAPAEEPAEAPPALTLESATEEQLKQEAKQAEDRQRIAEGQARRLTGTAGEMGTPDMLDVTAGEAPLLSQPERREAAPAPAAEAAPAPKAEAAPAPKAEAAPAPAAEAAPAPAAEAAPAPAAEAAPAPAAEAAPAPKASSEKLEKIRAKREDLFAKFRKKSGQTSMGIDSELASIAAQIAATYVQEGVVRFADFAARVKEDAADMWDQIRGYLRGAWAQNADQNSELDDVSRDEANEIFDALNAIPPPVVPVAEEPNEDLSVSDADAAPTPAPVGEPATLEERGVKLGFGKTRKNKSINQLIAEGDSQYLFETLFDDEAMVKALENNASSVARARDVVSRTPEYQEHLAEKAKTPAQRQAENAPLAEQVAQGVGAINQTAGFSAKVAQDGSVVLTVPDAYKPLATRNGFSWNNTAKGYVAQSYPKVVQFMQELRDAQTGKEVTIQNRTPEGVYKSKARAAQQSEADQSVLSAEAVEQGVGTRIKNIVLRGLGFGIPAESLAEQLHDIALITKAQQDGKPMFLLASGTGTGKTFVLGGTIAELRRRGVKGRIVFVTQSKDLIDQNKSDMAEFLEASGNLQDVLDSTPAEQREEAVKDWLFRNPEAAEALQKAVDAAAEGKMEELALEEAIERYGKKGLAFQVMDGAIAVFKRVSGSLRPVYGYPIRGKLGELRPDWNFLKPVVLGEDGKIVPLSERFGTPAEQDSAYNDLLTVENETSVEFISYANLDDAEKFAPRESDVLVFDESQNIRYSGEDKASDRAEKAAAWIAKSKFTLFSSATPFESAQQMRFLWPTKVFDLLPQGRPFGDAENNWYNFVAAIGGRVLTDKNTGKPKSTDFSKQSKSERMEGIKFARDFLYKKGMMIHRASKIPAEMVESNFVEVEGSEEWADLANEVMEAAAALKGADRNTKGYITHMLKRILEFSKIKEAARLALSEVEQGRQVVLFVETRSEKKLDLQSLVDTWKEHKKGAPLPEGFKPRMDGAIKLFEALLERGVTTIEFPSVQDIFKEALGDKVAFYTGNEKGATGDDSLGRWRSKRVPVLVATIARGGAGLSLHDRSEDGSAPRTQIVLTLPWRATETDQVAGRTARYGMTSTARMVWLFANNILNEKSLAAKVGERMTSMASLVQGAPSVASERISNWEFDPMGETLFAPADEVQFDVSTDPASAEAIEEVQLEASAEPAASAKPSDRVVGNVSMEAMEAGLKALARLFPGIRNLVRIDTAANLLADPNITEAEKNKIRQGAQGLYYRGRVLIAQDNVRQTVFHKDQTVAASVVIFHELMHRGADVIKSSPQLRSLYARWESMLSSNVSSTELDNLVRQGYEEYSNWREDKDKKLRAQEEIFVRKLESLLARKGVGEFTHESSMLRQFIDWMRDLLNKVFGLTPQESFPDAVLRDWGREFIRASNISGYVRYIKNSNIAPDIRQSAAPYDAGSDLPIGMGTPRTGMESLDPQEQALFNQYISQNPDLSSLKLTQLIGYGGQGNVNRREELLPLKGAAMDLIGFNEDGSGFPIVSEAATARARNIAVQLMDTKSKFGERYQSQFGPESAATAVLQMELVRYGQAMLQQGDFSLLGFLNKNTNSVVLGGYVTATLAGRVLKARSFYVSDVWKTVAEYSDLAKEALLESMMANGAAREEAESIYSGIQKAIEAAEMTQQQLRELNAALAANPGADKVNESEDVLGRIERGLGLVGAKTSQIYKALTGKLLQLAKAQDALKKAKAASAASPDVSASFFTEPTDGDLPTDVGALEALVAALTQEADALGKQLADSLLPPGGGAPIRKKRPPTPEGGAPSDTETVEDTETPVSEAEAAAQKIIDELKQFLDRKFSKKAPKETIYRFLKRLVNDRIGNVENLDFYDFKDKLSAELDGQDIADETKEELIAKAWTVYSRHPEKDAERISAQFKRLRDGWAKHTRQLPEKTEKLRELVQAALRNPENLELGDFVDALAPKLEALGIKAELASELAEDTFNEFARREEQKNTRRFNAVRSALLGGARSLLLEKLSVGDASDPVWRADTLRALLEESGLSDAEIDNALPRFTDSDLDIIFGTTPETTPEVLNRRIERLKRRYEESLKRPKEEKEGVARQDNIRRLLRRQLRVPARREAFLAQASMFGATREQAEQLFELTERERTLYVTETGKSPTLLSKLVEYVRSAPEAIRNQPENRNLAIQQFLEQNGFDKVQIRAALPWITKEFDKFIVAAKQKALEAEAKRIDDNLRRSEERRKVSQTDKLRQLIAKDLDLIRIGLGQVVDKPELSEEGRGSESDPLQFILNQERFGFTGFKKNDYRILSDLDLLITRALQDGRAHDMARGLKELYDFMGRRKAPKTFLQQLAVSYNNSALSGVGTLAINIVAPGGALAVRASLDIAKHLARGNLKGVSDVAKIMTDSMANIVREVEFSLVGGANLNAMQSMIGRATNLQPELRANLKVFNDKGASPQRRLMAGFRVLMAYTDITRRLLGTTDHVWYTVMQNYFLKTQGLKELVNAGVPHEKAMAMLFYRSHETSAALQSELEAIANLEATIQETSDAELYTAMKTFLGRATPEGMTEQQAIFEDDLRASVRRTAVAFHSDPKKLRKNLLAETKLQKSMATLRANDRSKKELKADIVGLMDPAKQKAVQENLDAAEVKETEFEMGTHRGEESPMYDLANILAMQVQQAGSAVIRRNPILGRMLLGYFGIPINLLNRSLWFTPYGLIRYAIAQQAFKTPEGRKKFYTQSMTSQAQVRQRFVEATVGTTATIALVALQLLSGDGDDERMFNVTLAGPVNKAEYDAWYKMGNRKGSIIWNIGGVKATLNWARGPLESLKVALLMVGAVDDMRLNRKLGDDETQVSLAEYLSAVLSGWNQQASFFGAKSTIGATLAVSPDASVAGTLLYKLNPVIPFSGLIASAEKFITGPNQFRGRTGALFMNLPVARSLLTERAVNPLGDAVGNTLQNPFAQVMERLWYAGMPMTLTSPVSGPDAKIYQFILDRGVAPGLPQRSALESKNGLMWDSDWQRYVEYRGGILKSEIARNLARLNRMSDDDLPKAIAELSTRATKQAKRRFNYQ